jgi:CDP-paratose 2-epimerase
MTMSFPSKRRAVLIVGGAGFIGSNWADYLLTKTDADVHIFDNLSRRKVEHNVKWLKSRPGAGARLKITIADIRDTRAVAKAVYDATEVYHFAAQVAVTTSLDDPRSDFEVNAGGTLNVLEAARQSGNRPFLLFTSTNKVYGKLGADASNAQAEQKATGESQPLDFYSPYGCSKGTADQYVHDYARIFGLPNVVFRMSCIAGPRQFGNEDQGWVAHFVYSALQRKPISIYGDGHQVRDVLGVSDLVRAFAAAYENHKTTAGQIYNIGGGTENTISLLELVKTMENTLRVPVRFRFCPARPENQPIYVTDFTKFREHTHWTPQRSVLQTVNDIWKWYEENQSVFLPRTFSVPAGLHETVREIAS